MNADLELAIAVYPDKQWKIDEERTLPFLGNGMYFYPPHFDSQFVDTLAWLIVTAKGYFDMGSPTNVALFRDATDETEEAWEYFAHDGTASGIKQAVYEAAKRVVMEGKE